MRIGTAIAVTDRPADVHRLALVLADHRAVPPPGIAQSDFAAACLADSYEVLADLEEVLAGIAVVRAVPDRTDPARNDLARTDPAYTVGAPQTDNLAELLWPGDLLLPLDPPPDRMSARPHSVPDPGGGVDLRTVADALERVLISRPGAVITELILVPADVPDLPGLVLAKVAKALYRADVCTAPEVGGDGLAAFGVRLPWPDWLDLDLDLDHDPHAELTRSAPRRGQVARVPGWHRMRRPGGIDRLDPGLEGWDQVRLLLT